MSTEISLDMSEPWTDVMTQEPIPINIMTTGGDSAVIAPWLTPDEPPSPPPKNNHSSRTLAFSRKRSVPQLVHRLGSSPNLPSSRGRGSGSESLAESYSSAHTEKQASSIETRKSKSNLNIMHIIRKKASKIGRDDSSSLLSVNQQPPPLPSPTPSSSFLPMQPSPPPPTPKKVKRNKRPKSPGPPPLPSKEPELLLDTNLDEMEGIVNLSMAGHTDFRRMNGEASSPGSGFESSYHSSSLSTSDTSFPPLHVTTTPPSQMYSSMNMSAHHMGFSNPFQPPTTASRRKAAPPNLDLRKGVSPKTIVPVAPLAGAETAEQHSPGWVAPESWAVEKEGEVQDVPDYTSTEEEDNATKAQIKQQRRRTKTNRRGVQSIPTYQIRIHRNDGSYHVVKCPLTTTVAELIPVMNRKLVLDSTRETHSLYVKERERERVLAPTERPAGLVKRRLEQAGYDAADGLQTLGSDEIGFLIKFIYKSNLLGGAGEDEVIVDNYEFINLVGRSLKTIPIVLHSHASTIVSINLSRNPMLEIPLDFIQSCTTLRELRLSNMAMKKVPQSIRHSVTLNRLDISCNRIADLDDAGLERIPRLTYLKVQNNRIEKLPTYFAQLRALTSLNISNNKFKDLPAAISELIELKDLDISFNNISSLPEEIGQLHNLQRLVIVGNQISKIPEECRGLVSLVLLDCRRNNLSDLSLVCKLPKVDTLYADHNAVHALDLVVGPRLTHFDASSNDITQLRVMDLHTSEPFRLTSLNISHAKLSSLDGVALSHLTELKELRLAHNSFRFIPDTLGALQRLEYLSVSDNHLDALPDSIGDLMSLRTLDAHNNSLSELPVSMWQCSSLEIINVTSNLLINWHDPPGPPIGSDIYSSGGDSQRKPSTAGSVNGTQSYTPPLAKSLRKLYLGENRLTDDALHPLTILRELQVLNLSFNNIQELPPSFFRNLRNLEEIYLSGNNLSTIPTEDLTKLERLSVMFLNGNKLQVLPSELASLKNLAVMDVGSNMLKYNIINHEFDWNWNFNKNLKYLNLSGNKRFKIQQADAHRMSIAHQMSRKVSADFSGLPQLRVLGLMDVTTAIPTIPEDTEDRRVRTTLSEVNNMAYGIADTLGRQDFLSVLDVVLPEFRGQKDECIFAMFGRFDCPSNNNRVSKFLCENFAKTFSTQLDKLDRSANEAIPDALRRTFLMLNKNMHAFLVASANYSRKMSTASIVTTTAATISSSMSTDLSVLRNGASGIVVYFVGKTIYVANAGDALAVISRQGTASLVAQKHEPFDRGETARIRAAEGMVSPNGLVNEECDVSRSFGFYHLLPAVNPRPEIRTWEVSELDEFIIIANRGLWDYVSYQTAVDIARSERDDPMIAAQKLRDFAISYGADKSTMIMVICVAHLFRDDPTRSRQATITSLVDGSEMYQARRPRQKAQDIGDVTLSRLPKEVHAPTGHVALVFTDIRNSTRLWDANAGMPTAMRIHNALLRRQLRLCGGYEVKTEGDAFMCSFSNIISALQWALTCQLQLLHESWPLEILECDDGREFRDSQNRVVERGLSVRMGIHLGTPVCEPDPITHRMDYFGPMVNRTARISGSAAGGQIMCSADVTREIRAHILSNDLDHELDPALKASVDTIRGVGVEIVHVGETRMKGLEIPEVLSLVYPSELIERQNLRESAVERDPAGSKVQFSVVQTRQLAVLCVRLEALASNRVLRAPPERKPSVPQSATKDAPTSPADSDPVIMYADPNLLIPNISDKATDRELMAILDSLSQRIESAWATINLRRMGNKPQTLLDCLQRGEEIDNATLLEVLALLTSATPAPSSSLDDPVVP